MCECCVCVYGHVCVTVTIKEKATMSMREGVVGKGDIWERFER